jgi:hypothetical protein
MKGLNGKEKKNHGRAVYSQDNLGLAAYHFETIKFPYPLHSLNLTKPDAYI